MGTLIVLRGLPGAGKSTLAHLLAEGQWPVLSVDDYFTDTESGKYNFVYSENHLAYKNCIDQVEAQMKCGTEKIFVANTFTMAWEMEPYLKLAEKYRYSVHVATVENFHGGKNVHGISDEQLQRMAAGYKPRLM